MTGSAIPDDADLVSLAERAVALALRNGAQQAEAYVASGASLSVDLEGGRIACIGAVEGHGVGLRVVRNGRVGFASCTNPDDLARAAQRALQHARLAPSKGFRLPSSDGVARLPRRWDDDLARLDAQDASRLAKDLVQGAAETCPGGVVAGGSVDLAWSMEALVNSEGIEVTDRSTLVSAGVSMVLEDGASAISAGDHAVQHTGGVDAHGLGAEAGRKTSSLRDPGEPPSGVLDVVFAPDAVAELVHGLLVSAAIGDDALRGTTVWSGRSGKAVAAPGFHLVDDPLHPEAVGVSPWDGDGMAVRRTPIVAGGVLRTYIFDAYTACLHGVTSTASAVRDGTRSPPETGVHHLVVSGDRSLPLERLVGDVDEGIYVDTVLGAHTANVTTGDFSVTAPNVWRIREGAMVGACKEVALSGNLPEMLMRFGGAGDTPKVMSGARVPPLLFRDVAVSS